MPLAKICENLLYVPRVPISRVRPAFRVSTPPVLGGQVRLGEVVATHSWRACCWCYCSFLSKCETARTTVLLDVLIYIWSLTLSCVHDASERYRSVGGGGDCCLPCASRHARCGYSAALVRRHTRQSVHTHTSFVAGCTAADEKQCTERASVYCCRVGENKMLTAVHSELSVRTRETCTWTLPAGFLRLVLCVTRFSTDQEGGEPPARLPVHRCHAPQNKA